MKNKLNILVINDQAWALGAYFDNLEDKLNFKKTSLGSALVAIQNYNPLDYQLLILDMSDDIWLNEYNKKSFSEYWKEKNPNGIIIGTSVSPTFNDELCKKRYNHIIDILRDDLDKGILEILKKYEQFKKYIK